MFNIIKKTYLGLDLIRNLIIVIFFSLIIIMCFAEVVARNLYFIKGIGGTEEILRYLNVWIVLIGASIAVKTGSHFELDYFFNKMVPEKYHLIANRIIYLIVILFLVLILVQGVIKTYQNIDQNIQAIPIPIALFYAAIPIGTFYMIIDYLFIFYYKVHPFYRQMEE